jgi:hypothetical protein
MLYTVVVVIKNTVLKGKQNRKASQNKGKKARLTGAVSAK